MQLTGAASEDQEQSPVAAPDTVEVQTVADAKGDENGLYLGRLKVAARAECKGGFGELRLRDRQSSKRIKKTVLQPKTV